MEDVVGCVKEFCIYPESLKGFKQGNDTSNLPFGRSF